MIKLEKKNKFGAIEINGELKLGKIYSDKENKSENVLFQTNKNEIIENAELFTIDN